MPHLGRSWTLWNKSYFGDNHKVEVQKWREWKTLTYKSSLKLRPPGKKKPMLFSWRYRIATLVSCTILPDFTPSAISLIIPSAIYIKPLLTFTKIRKLRLTCKCTPLYLYNGYWWYGEKKPPPFCDLRLLPPNDCNATCFVVFIEFAVRIRRSMKTERTRVLARSWHAKIIAYLWSNVVNYLLSYSYEVLTA